MTTEDYYKTNPIVKSFINKLDTERLDYYEKNFPVLVSKFKKVDVRIGKKFIKIIADNSVWGFISRVDGVYLDAPIKKGDLLKAASFASPARHSRGNIIDGTAKYGPYGPNYIK